MKKVITGTPLFKNKNLMIENIENWLNEEPDEADVKRTPDGNAFHVPIERLRPLLDKVHGYTKNYHYELYKHGNNGFAVSASIELIIAYTHSDGSIINRGASGACNFTLASIQPIKDWNATAKSQCIKNAAKELARKFGRDLNNDLPEPVPDTRGEELTVMPQTKKKADKGILAQLEEAKNNGNEAAISLIENWYDVNQDNA